MDTGLVSAVIVALFSFFGVFVNAKYTKNNSIVRLEMRLEELIRQVNKHNGVIERMYKIENKMAVIEHCINEQCEG